jgi:hypothetical protein
MSDPRYEPNLGDPVERRADGAGGLWGWIAGIAVVVLIAIILIAGWNSTETGVSSAPPAATTGSAPNSGPTAPAPAPRRP